MFEIGLQVRLVSCAIAIRTRLLGERDTWSTAESSVLTAEVILDQLSARLPQIWKWTQPIGGAV